MTKKKKVRAHLLDNRDLIEYITSIYDPYEKFEKLVWANIYKQIVEYGNARLIYINQE